MTATLTLPANDMRFIVAWAIKTQSDCRALSKSYESAGDSAAARRAELDELADTALRIYLAASAAIQRAKDQS